MKVFLCEKPSQAKDYASALKVSNRKDGYFESSDIIITWAIGHLIQDYEPKDYDEKYKQWNIEHLPIIPEVWKDKVSDTKKKQYNVIKSILSKLTNNDFVYIATDAAREGEVIAVELIEKMNCKAQRKRVWNNSLTESAILEDIKNAKDASETYNLYLSGLARKRADWLIGMNMTIGVTAANKGLMDGIFSIGRVQTPTLTLVVNRDLEIENFKSKNFYEVLASFDHPNGKFNASWKPNKELLIDDKYILDENIVKNIKDKVFGKDGVVKKFTKDLKKTNAPVGFNLSGLTKIACSKFGFTAQQVLDICQGLYETHKATTYPRTDSEYLPLDQFGNVPKVLKSLKNNFSSNDNIKKIIDLCDVNKKSKIWNNSKVSDHHAIIPTDINLNLSNLNDNETKIYNLIVNRYLAQFLPEYEYYSSSIEIEIEKELFAVTGNVPYKQGWKIIDSDDEDCNKEKKELPILSNGDSVNCFASKVETKQTKPPSRYNDGSLIDDMKKIGKFISDLKMKKLINENEGLGTEATRANLIETLISRGFLKREKKYLVSTDKGRSLISIAPELLKNPETSAYWEQELNKIAKGEQTFDKFLGQQKTVLNRLLNEIKDGKCTLNKSVGFNYVCAKCNTGLKRITSKNKNKYWVHVVKKDNCQFIYEDNRGKPGKEIDLTPIDQGNEEYLCSSCNSKLIRRNGEYGYYWSCSNYKVCKSKSLPDDNGKPGVRKERIIEKTNYKCPSCDVGYLRSLPTKKGGIFWACNNFPKCDYKAFDDNGKPKEKNEEKK